MANNRRAVTSGSAAASEGKPENRKFRLILETARRLFLHQGFDASSMDLVARAAGVSKATLYVHFENKEALLLALVEDECRRLAPPSRLWEPEPGPLDVKRTLLAIARKFTSHFLDNRGLAFHRLMTAEASRFPKISRAFYEAVPVRLYAEVAAFLAAAVAEGRLVIPDIQLAVTQFLSLVRGDLMLYWSLGVRQVSKQEYDALIESGVAVFLAAYGRRPGRDD